MESLFSQVLNMSLTASVVILFVLAARLALRKAPKIFSYALWSVVLFRLLCPVSLPSPVSLIKVTDVSVLGMQGPQLIDSGGGTNSVSYVPAEFVYGESDLAHVRSEKPSDTGAVPQKAVSPMTVAAVVWLAGIAGMLLRSAAAYIDLRRKLVGAVLFRGNVYLADHIPSPFVMGIFHPKIYLPSGIPPKERLYIVSHERHHIRRGDHIIKLLAYGALSIHWFNPLVWVAFVQAGKDMEMSCDEAVIKRLGPQIRAEYSASLLRLATGQRIIVGTPLAFGEGDTKGRIRNMAKWKQPKLWASVLCAVASIAILAACALNPSGEGGGYPAVSLILPEGYDVAIDINGNTVFTDGQQVIGGVYRYEEPEVRLKVSDAGEWLEAMGVPEITTGAYDYVCHSGTYGYLSATFSNPAGESWHEYFLQKGTVTDVWLDMDVIDAGTKTDILASVQIDDSVSEEKHPDLSLNLPSGYTYETDADGNVVFTNGQLVIGGILRYDRPDMELTIQDCEQWLEAMGVPQIVEGGYDRMASTGYEHYSHMTVSFSNAEGETKHEYYLWQDSVTDIWLDTSLNTGVQSDIMESVRYSDPLVTERDGEETLQSFVEVGELPEGYSYETVENGDVIFSDGTNTVGGVTSYLIPMDDYDPDDGAFLWLDKPIWAA